MNYDEQIQLATEAAKVGNYAEAALIAHTILAASKPSDEFHAAALLILARSADIQGEFEQVLLHAKAALSLAEAHHHGYLKRRAWNLLGTAYTNLGSFDKALEFYGMALAEYEIIGEKPAIAGVTGNIGIVYAGLGSNDKALEYFGRALAAHEELGVIPAIALVTGNIGTIYKNLNSLDNALSYYNKALALHRELGDKFMAAGVMGNIGLLYQDLGNYNLALEYYRAALAVFEEVEAKSDIARVRGNIGIVYMSIGNYTVALENFSNALATHEEIGAQSEVALISGNIGELYAIKDFTGYDTAKAEEYLCKAISICEKIGIKKNVSLFHGILAELYKDLKRWEDFAKHINKSIDVEKEVQSEEIRKQAEKFAIERDVAVMKKEREILSIKNAELAEKNSQLKQVNAKKNEFLGIAAHDLKNPLNSITMLATILEDEALTLSREEFREFAGHIRTQSKQMFDLIIELLDINKIEQEDTLHDSEIFNVAECLNFILKKFELQAQSKHIHLVTECDDAFVQTSKTAFIQILDNLISNAIKFSPFRTSVRITATVADSILRISVKDNGPGLTAEDMSKLFGKFTRLSAQPTGGEHSTGLGLSIVHRLVEMMNGKIWCESEVGKGATFILVLPAVP